MKVTIERGNDKQKNTAGGDEKVLVGSIQKFSIEDGPGIRTTVFFKGCPLSCSWCHNPEMIEAAQQLIYSKKRCIGCGYCITVCPKGAISFADAEDAAGVNGAAGSAADAEGCAAGRKVVIDRDKCDVCLECVPTCYAGALRPVAKEMTACEIIDKAEEDKEFYDSTGGGITLSGGEVLSRGEFVGDVIDEAARRGINVCLDTCGHWDSELLVALAKKPNVTDVLYDLKAADDDVHRRYTGVSNKLILENLSLLASDPETAPMLNVRMPVVAGVNDSDEMIEKAGKIIAENGIGKVTLLPYHDLGIIKAKNIGAEQERFEAPPDERIDEIAAYFKDVIGVQVEILGKV